MGIYREAGKRSFDVLLSLTGFAFFTLPMAWIAYRVWKEAGRPVLFHQIRIGWRGEPFLLRKFRTMTPEGCVTRFGKSLRVTAMDELPQLFNILQGEMSFVGPRPLVPGELKEFDGIPGASRRLTVRPGLTGLAQLYSEKVPDFSQRLKWDLVYTDRVSLGLDLKLLFRSLWVTFQRGWEKL